MGYRKATGVVVLNVALVGAILCQQPILHGDSNSRRLRNKSERADAAHDAMVKIPGGVTQMGIDESDVKRLQKLWGADDAELFTPEIPKHSVTIKSFYLDKYLITNGQFKKFVDANPFWRRDHIPANLDNRNYLRHWKNSDDIPFNKENHPVVNVNWYSAVAYCRWVGERLPTEAEWEHAARGGLKGLFPWGNQPPNKQSANYEASGIGSTSPVGSYPANGYGLFDMAGNVWEFMADEWQSYQRDSQTNPIAGDDLFLAGNTFLTVKSRRVIRGGSWGGAPVNLWVQYRDSHPPEGSKDFVGFRCAQSLDEN